MRSPFLWFFIAAFGFSTGNGFDLLEHEDWIPFYVELSEGISVEGTEIAAGTRAIAIRPIGRDALLLDVSRKGLFVVDIQSTNVREQIEALQARSPTHMKRNPRMSYFFMNRLMTGSSNWQDPLGTEKIIQFSRWLLLYGSSDEDNTAAAIRLASDFHRNLPAEEREETALVFFDIAGDKESIQELSEQLNPTILCMPAYLSRGYVKTLNHIQEQAEVPQLVEVANSGRIIAQVNGLEAIHGFLESE